MCLFTADVPGKPEGPIRVSDINRDVMTVHWNPPKKTGGMPVKSYTIERHDTKRTSWVRAGKVEGDVTSLKVTGLAEGGEYSFRVCAENNVGLGEFLESSETYIAESPFGTLTKWPPAFGLYCVWFCDIAILGFFRCFVLTNFPFLNHSPCAFCRPQTLYPHHSAKRLTRRIGYTLFFASLTTTLSATAFVSYTQFW